MAYFTKKNVINFLSEQDLVWLGKQYKEGEEGCIHPVEVEELSKNSKAGPGIVTYINLFDKKTKKQESIVFIGNDVYNLSRCRLCVDDFNFSILTDASDENMVYDGHSFKEFCNFDVKWMLYLAKLYPEHINKSKDNLSARKDTIEKTLLSIRLTEKQGTKALAIKDRYEKAINELDEIEKASQNSSNK